MEKLYQSNPTLQVVPSFYSGGIPVFEPSMSQFEDFYSFNKAINEYGMRSGIVKVIPPKEWLKQMEGTYTKENLARINIKNPIVQNMNLSSGYKGVYSCQNVERQRKFDICQWKSLSEKQNHMPPAHKKNRRGSVRPINGDKRVNNSDHSMNTRKRGKAHDISVIDSIVEGEFNIPVSEFDSERCEELEQLYWKSLGYAEPMYGADMLGSLFKDTTRSWNVAKLPNLLDLMDEKLPGVNDAYLYAGLWKATFSWHLEDQDLYSINYLHFGAPKQWYSIPQSQNKKFFKLMSEIFSEDFKNCSEFLRHKTFLASPQFLEKKGITCNKITHKQGEFMITYPYGYHAGFNYGYNLAESVNFALDDWFDFANKARKCECIKDSVGINYRQIFCKFKGIPYPPSEVAKRVAINDLELFNSKESKKITKKFSAKKQCLKEGSTQNPRVSTQCVLCPMELPSALLRLQKFELIDTNQKDSRTGKALQIHRICGEIFQPEVKFKRQSTDSTDSTKPTNDIVADIENIDRPLRNLKCLGCHLPNYLSTLPKTISRGACFQCSVPKCTKSYHVTCALSTGFLFKKRLCKTHRKMVSKYHQRQSLELHDKLSKIPARSLIQYSNSNTGRRHTGQVFCGFVVRNTVDEKTFEILIFPDMQETRIISYDDIVLGEAADVDNSEFFGLEEAGLLCDPNIIAASQEHNSPLSVGISPEQFFGNSNSGHPKFGSIENKFNFTEIKPYVSGTNGKKQSYLFVKEYPGTFQKGFSSAELKSITMDTN